MRRWFPALIVVLIIAPLVVWLRVQAAPLSAIYAGGPGPPAIVMLHGYGSNAEDWLQFTDTIKIPRHGRFVFPQGPWRGPEGRRGWWWLHLQGYVVEGGPSPDLSNANPAGLTVASSLLHRFLNGMPQPIVLGGFSQGAMLSAEVAFRTDQPLAALILLGGTPVHEAKWVERFPSRRGLPIFIAHGRNDGVLSFEIADRFRAKMQAAGLDVTWVPFDGGHDVPTEVVAALNAFIARLPL